MKIIQVHDFGILDHEFVGAGPDWKVYVRVVPNEEGSTTTWTFMKPDGLTDDRFQEQLKGFDTEVDNWKKIWKKIKNQIIRNSIHHEGSK